MEAQYVAMEYSNRISIEPQTYKFFAFISLSRVVKIVVGRICFHILHFVSIALVIFNPSY